ncbi:tRNA pseudouridine(38-40) synthase TruA [Nordella sp. HKS 07]|uniref:tRNA pseudouridine(38-40) synthase TruA n=1 Tax=Nordella sp. HKS 07 TaxID=2712222 RepID=UPI0013E12A9B|nr:tRNA pseudouridine(38-40) synthase TruA [Nordella sp. HKS 07]QIG49506.1 tRNA pseudouridine(38-40) synthase TruA [Nordella sp. HKS 07]
MARYKMIIEYDGGPFAGWQLQADALTVQGVLEDAVSVLAGGERPVVHAAGRTDAGVHAIGQVAHVDLERSWQTRILRNAINAHLRPHPVSVLAVEEVGPNFHARFSAIRRHYLYRIVNRPAPLALEQGKAWWHPVPLDHKAMHEAAQALLGKHDFTTFRASSCQAQSPVKTLDRLDVTRDSDVIDIFVEARSFLHHQVRSMVGSLKLVGEGKWPVEEIGNALHAHDRTRCGPVAPPTGLYLTQVDY